MGISLKGVILKMITNDRNYRNFNVESGQDEYIVEGRAVVFDSPTMLYEWDGVQYFEIIDKNSFNGVDLSDVVLNIDHEGKPLARTKNGTLKLEIREDGLWFWADLSKSVQSREVYEEVKNGLFDKMSFSFTIKEHKYDKDTRTDTITKIKRLWDVSIVTYPAYEKTLLNARSFFKTEVEKEQQMLENIKLRKDKLKLKLKLEV
jgi:uncharacterized protein